MNITTQKNGGGLQKQCGNFIQNVCNDSVYISAIYGGHISK
jgi:hypothetical protein